MAQTKTIYDATNKNSMLLCKLTHMSDETHSVDHHSYTFEASNCHTDGLWTHNRNTFNAQNYVSITQNDCITVIQTFSPQPPLKFALTTFSFVPKYITYKTVIVKLLLKNTKFGLVHQKNSLLRFFQPQQSPLFENQPLQLYWFNGNQTR